MCGRVVGRLAAGMADAAVRWGAGLLAAGLETGGRLGRRLAALRIRPGRAGWIGGGLVVATAAPLLVAGPLAWAVGWLAFPFLSADLAYADARAAGTAVFDTRGRFLGIVPGNRDSLGDISTGPVPSEDHKTLAPRHVPPVFLACLIHLEDRRFGSWLAPNGVDPLGVAAALLGRRGGSTLPMQLARALDHRDPGADRTVFQRLHRKSYEMTAAAVLTRMLPAAGTGPDSMAGWLARHVPLVQGTSGAAMGAGLYGIETAARVLFGLPADRLPAEHQAVLAAAFFRPILLAPDGDGAAEAVRDARWRRLTARAARCFTEGGAAGYGGETAAAVRALPVPRPHLDPDLAALLPADAAARFRIAANPFRRAAVFAGPALGSALNEVKDRHGFRWREHVPTLHLTLDAAVNARFHRRIAAALPGLERTLGPRLSQPLAQAQITVAVTDAQGRMVRFFEQGAVPFYGGSPSARDGDGRYHPERESRALGSVVKMVAALAVADTDTGGRPYCNQRREGVPDRGRNRGVDRCSGAGAWISARTVFARSLNLPVLWRLARVPEEPLDGLARWYGLAVPPGLSPRTALGFGLAAGAPRTAQRLALSLAAGTAGHSPRVPLPSLLEHGSKVASADAGAQAGHAGTGAGGEATGPFPSPGAPFPPRARRFLADVLGAPLLPGGTLSALAGWHPAAHPRVSLHLAKTGTTGTPSGGTRDALAVGGVTIRGRLYAYAVVIGSPDPAQALGPAVHGRDLVPLIRILLEDLDR